MKEQLLPVFIALLTEQAQLNISKWPSLPIILGLATRLQRFSPLFFFNGTSTLKCLVVEYGLVFRQTEPKICLTLKQALSKRESMYTEVDIDESDGIDYDFLVNKVVGQPIYWMLNWPSC
eukprot:Pgem_evm2s1987